MRKSKLTKNERAIEKALLQGEYTDVSSKAFESIAQSVARRKKDAVLNIRVNSEDLEIIKRKAKKMGIKYQTFISELLHRIAHS